ncbi:GntR family transcriptional regulator [Arthrobacter sp. ISL-30]|uniref:GntR family transcriptional regulator n=1 Tax=Arthrobacter sp. ISL-30 TaxID=2819109 RepID=UPI001BEB7D10|nr:GntR family transcriptional regulator [Arthrobacter sp. ISL-30]MBT2513458.1 GntR family transcriptional regulator [Arthrobacter sp. ISL-30]
MSDNAVQFLSRPITPQPGQPLRVAAYSRIAEAIRTRLLPPGSLLPTETELGIMMDVSRTVIREALMLLEEDGLTRARRGVGRFVADSLPRIGIEKIRPFDQLLGGSEHDVQVKRVLTELQPASEFVAPGISVEPGEECWLWESVLIRNGEPIAHLQEHAPAGSGTGAGSDVDQLASAAELAVRKTLAAQTLLEVLSGLPGQALGPGECEISLSTAGPSRAKLLALRPSDPVLVLTQYVRRSGAPFYLAKCLVAAKAGHLSVIQSA